MSFFYSPNPSFGVSNDRVLDNLRVRQPNTFKLPPSSNIDPNFPVPSEGNNDPATNSTLRSKVAQAGSLVYSTKAIIAHESPTGCFDGRNHLYFSDGDQWIPLANCPTEETMDAPGGNINNVQLNDGNNNLMGSNKLSFDGATMTISTNENSDDGQIIISPNLSSVYTIDAGTIDAIHIGRISGLTNSKTGSIGIGSGAGLVDQNTYSVSIGYGAGQTSQNSNSIAIGYLAGNDTQQGSSISIGKCAGQTTQNSLSIAIGASAGNLNQSGSAIAIGLNAGGTNQSQRAIAIGVNAGVSGQGEDSIGIGKSSAAAQSAPFSINIGYEAGNAQNDGGIILNSEGYNGGLNNTTGVAGFFVNKENMIDETGCTNLNNIPTATIYSVGYDTNLQQFVLLKP